MTCKTKALVIVLSVTSTLCLLEGLVIFNLSGLNSKALDARLASPTSDDVRERLIQLQREARSRAALYNLQIEQSMLLDGMVVDRNRTGDPMSVCDSLLFSALRYRSLVALGFADSARQAWEAILLSRDRGHWWRHPLCSHESLSRDMLMGLLVALEASPPGAKKLVEELLAEIQSRGGSFSDGPIFVSYLSPGPAGLLRHLAERFKVGSAKWPWVLKQSFSSIEYDTLFIKPGFESHLAALGLWLEYQFMNQDPGFNPRSILGELEKVLTVKPPGRSPKRIGSIDDSRMLWVANTLAQSNPNNLFFATLRLQISGGLTDGARLAMLEKLLAMPQFPSDRLPQDCDKDADYLWQRKDSDYLPRKKACDVIYPGVDYLWMA
ncbi:MAG: hypothetical protein NTV34_10880, partial [Proteobacteria bacterium]|nr:hypothetical protein [Pseudomonadota bacterium]